MFICKSGLLQRCESVSEVLVFQTHTHRSRDQMGFETRVTEYFEDVLDKQKQFQNGKSALGGVCTGKPVLGGSLDTAADSDMLWL